MSGSRRGGVGGTCLVLALNALNIHTWDCFPRLSHTDLLLNLPQSLKSYQTALILTLQIFNSSSISEKQYHP